MLLYYITDRRQFPGSSSEQRRRLLEKIGEAAGCGVDFIQLREKDLTTRELEQLACDAVYAVHEASAGSGKHPHLPLRLRSGQAPPGRCGAPSRTRLLINSRLDVALAAGADGVHLRGDDISASDARALWSKAAGNWKREAGSCIIGVSCHTAEAVRAAEAHGADFAVFAPVFEKSGRPGVGLDRLRAACAGLPPAAGPEASPMRRFQVLALGGVTLENARACVQAGAAGVAGIRLFQENDIARIVAQLRAGAAQESR